MSVNNVSAVSDALKYINGLDVEKQETNIVSDVKNSIFNPVTLLFGANEVMGNIKNTVGETKIKDAVKSLKNVSIGENKVISVAGKETKAISSTSVSEQFSNAVKNTVSKVDAKAEAKAAEKATEGVAKKGIFSTIKNGLKSAGKAVSSVVSKIPGASTVGKAIKTVTSKIGGSTFGKAIKGTGAGFMMVFEGITGLVTEVIPAFMQGGVDSGLKQLAQTGTKTVASGLGWAGGTLGATAIGAAIGSVFPGLGTIIGGAIGTFVGGILGSTVASGIANKVIGETELEKLQDEQFDEAAGQVAADSASMDELNQLVNAQVQAEIQNGTADEDTELMAQYLNSGAFSTTASTYTPSVTDTTQVTDTQAQTASNANYINEVAQKISEGDTSVYDISDEKLNSVFTSSASSTSSTSSTTTEEDDEDRINYFAMG